MGVQPPDLCTPWYWNQCRFAVAHTFRFLKQALVANALLRWERPTEPAALSPGRVQRGMEDLLRTRCSVPTQRMVRRWLAVS